MLSIEVCTRVVLNNRRVDRVGDLWYIDDQIIKLYTKNNAAEQETIVHCTSNAITALVVYRLIKLTSFLSEATPKNQSPVLFFTFSTPMNQSTQSASRAPTSLTTWNSFLHLPSRLRQVEPEWSHNLQRASCCRALPGSPDDSMGCPPESEFQGESFLFSQSLPSSASWWWSRFCWQWSCGKWWAASSFSCSVSIFYRHPPEVQNSPRIGLICKPTSVASGILSTPR